MKANRYQKVGTLFAALMVIGLAVPALAQSKNKLDAKIRDLTTYFETVQKDQTNAVPAEILSKAEGLVIMRTYKAGFIVGVAGGGGVALVRDKATGKWGPVGFLKSGEGSFGFQAGGQRSDVILALMNSDGLKLLTEPNFKMGVDVHATLGPRSAGEQANFKTDKTPVLIYSDTRGAFGGASVQTGGLFPDDRDNEEYYGKKLTMTEILMGGKVESTEASKLLGEKVEQYAKPAAR